MNPREIIKQNLGHYLADRNYPEKLPADLAPWHCYTIDGGHSILVALKAYYSPDKSPRNFLVPAPVKAVKKAGWVLTEEGFPLCDLPYSENLGLITAPDDDEF